MLDRGVHRGVYGALFDDPDYQALSAKARLVLLTLRLCAQAGPAAIFRYYVEVVVRQTGLTVRQVTLALEELAAPDRLWIVYDKAIVWVRNGLRHDPTMRLQNPKHKSAVTRALSALPHHDIVLKFCEYYGLAKPFDSLSNSLSNGWPTLALREPRAESREPRAESREPRAESREPRAESREPRAETALKDVRQKTPHPPPKKNPDIRTVLDAYQAVFMTANGGEKPHLTGKDAALARQLVTRHGVEKVLAVMKSMFESTDAWIAQSGRTLGVLSSQWNKLVSRPGVVLTDRERQNLEAGRRFIERGQRRTE